MLNNDYLSTNLKLFSYRHTPTIPQTMTWKTNGGHAKVIKLYVNIRNEKQFNRASCVYRKRNRYRGKRKHLDCLIVQIVPFTMNLNRIWLLRFTIVITRYIMEFESTHTSSSIAFHLLPSPHSKWCLPNRTRLSHYHLLM